MASTDDLLDPDLTQRPIAMRIVRVAAVAYFGVVAVWSLCDPMHWSFLSSLILATHELGHVVFAPFGEWMMVAGGTILQLLAPIAAYGVLRRQREPTALFVGGTWFVTSLANVATYAGDARAQELPLVSLGDSAEHDWAYLLGRAHALAADTRIAHDLRGVAWGILFGIIALYVLRSLRGTTDQPSSAEGSSTTDDD